MSQEAPDNRASFASLSSTDFFRHVRDVCLDEKIPDHLKVVEIINRHILSEASELVKVSDRPNAAKSLVSRNYRGLRYMFEKVNNDYFDKVTEKDDGGLLRLRVSVERIDPKTKTEKPTSVIAKVVESTVKKVAPKPVPDTSKLSPTERALLLNTTMEDVASIPLNDDEKAEIQKAAEEANALLKKQQEFVEWACRRADAEADVLRTKKGEALWTDAVTVETFPSDPTMKIVFVRSSTAPLLGTHGPSVKHDFRANGIPVTVNHDLMFRQLDNQRLIRSRVIRTNYHEYYVKALQYQEDMYLRGYFRSDGEDRHNLTRYYVISNGKVRQVSETEYREYENKAASRKKK